MKIIPLSDKIFTIHNFLTDTACENYIRLAQEIGFEAAKVESFGGATVIPAVRNNSRAFYESIETADELWSLLEPVYPVPAIGNSRAVGLNELFRFYCYQPGHRFKPHTDSSYVRNDLETSYFTFMIYLNDGCTGGETRFTELTVTPEKGMALLFWHSLEHEGCEVTSGVKYVLRTDVMYRFIEETNP